MKKSTIWILGIVMGLSFLSLLYLQVSYIEEMMKTRKEQFDSAVRNSLSQVSKDVEYAETQRWLVEDITEALWGTKVSSGTISNLNQKAYKHIEEWRSRPLSGNYPYVYVDGVFLKRSWGGEIKNVSVLVAIGVSEDGYREILGAAEGMKEDKESWHNFLTWLKGRGLTGVQLIVGDKNLGMLETIPEVYPETQYQRCTVHFYRNVFSATPRSKMPIVSMMLKAIHAQENKEAALEKAALVAKKLREMKLPAAAKKV